jgi:hypothetical protein
VFFGGVDNSILVMALRNGAVTGDGLKTSSLGFEGYGCFLQPVGTLTHISWVL